MEFVKSAYTIPHMHTGEIFAKAKRMESKGLYHLDAQSVINCRNPTDAS